ncbi:hypothetical protein ACPVPU_03650 [Sphingomonas sp. CJ99]
MPVPAPFLREPPFARPERRWPRRLADGPPPSGERMVDLARQIATTRVGGAFWRYADDEPTAPIVLTGGDPALLRAAADSFAPGVATVVADPGRDPWPIVSGATHLIYGSLNAVVLSAIAASVPTSRVTGETIAPVSGEAALALLSAAIGPADGWPSPYDPSTHWAVEAWVDYLGEWRRRIEKTRGIGTMTGISRWKRRRMHSFVPADPPVPVAAGAAAAVRAAKARNGAILAWPSRAPIGLMDGAARADVPVAWCEDGFIRSSGLGAALVQPGSIVIDRLAPHYDPARASELEQCLANQHPDDEACARARRLIDRLCGLGITKYNLTGTTADLPAGRRIALVCGQVGDDLSLRHAAPPGATMTALLARARAEEPHAYLIYKPHPDVVAGLRTGAIDVADTRRLADAVLPDADLAALLPRIDVLHCWSSLAGFEALLRGREVVVHGRPFYAGWGLTRDLWPPERRGRKLTLEQLVAIALIDYPLYADPLTGLPCSVEHLVDRLAAAPAMGKPPIAARIAAMVQRLRPSLINAPSQQRING